MRRPSCWRTGETEAIGKRSDEELLFVRGIANKDAAAKLGVSEQTIANHKFDFLAKLRAAVRQQGLPEDVFPELHDCG